MSDPVEGVPPGTDPDPAGTGWSEADLELARRLSDDEGRLTRDEARLATEERRLRQDEVRLAEDERRSDRSWKLILTLAGMLVLVIAALVMSVIALNRDIEAVAGAAPKDDSVGSSVIRDGAVAPADLADGAVTPRAIARGAVTPPAIGARAVTPPALAPGAVTRAAIAPGAVTRSAVAPDSLDGSRIDEATLARVPRSGRADVAADAAGLGGVPAAEHVSRVTVVRAATATSSAPQKGPLVAACPAGTTVVGGGAAVDGSRQVAITTSAPEGRSGWTAEAGEVSDVSAPWRLTVTAICARGG